MECNFVHPSHGCSPISFQSSHWPSLAIPVTGKRHPSCIGNSLALRKPGHLWTALALTGSSEHLAEAGG